MSSGRSRPTFGASTRPTTLATSSSKPASPPMRFANLIGGDAGFEELVAKVVGLVEAPNVGLDLPLDIRGTAFQQRVWQALREIPAGKTASYTDIARRIGRPK